MDAYRDWILAHASLVAYWPLISNLQDYKGTSHLIPTDVLNGHGDFAIDADPVFSIPAGWLVVGGKAVFGNPANSVLAKASSLVVGKTYDFTVTVDAVTAPGVRMQAGTSGVGFSGTDVVAPGTYTQRLTCGGSTTARIVGLDGATATIDNWTVREVYDGQVSPDGAYFNGVSNGLQTTSPVDLSGTNKITVLASIKVLTYNLVSGATIVESTVTAAAGFPGSFAALMLGATAEDPMRWAIYGDVGGNSADYYPAISGLALKRLEQHAFVGDFSLAGGSSGEVSWYKNAALMTKSAHVASHNNAGNFGNYVVYLGARGGTVSFAHMLVRDVAIFNTALTSTELVTAGSLLQDGIGFTKRIFSKQI